MRRLLIAIVLSCAVVIGIIALAHKGVAQSLDSSEQILEKLNTILRNEEEILRRLDAVKEELYIIKIRISKRG